MNSISIPEKFEVLIVDDDEAQRTYLSELVATLGGTVFEVDNGVAAIESIRAKPPDIILLDVEMPQMDGLTCCRKLKSNLETRLIPIVIITSKDTLEDRLEGISAGADDFLTKPIRAPELLTRMQALLRTKKLNETLESAENVIFAMALAIEAKDVYTEGHTERVTANAVKLGKVSGCSEHDLIGLRQGGILHDVGKIGVPDHILNKPGRLTTDEFEIIMMHPLTGFRICSPLKSLAHALPCIRWHHEKPNGKGYPDGLKGEQIPKLARILAVADVYDALVSKRSYKSAMPQSEAFAVLSEEGRIGGLDSEIVNDFIRNDLPNLKDEALWKSKAEDL